MNGKPAPIALFAYNRPWHTRQTIEALRANELAAKSDFHVFVDGPRGAEDLPLVAEVRDYLTTIEGFGSIRLVARDQNLGLAQSVISGVSEVVGTYGRVIVLEDDIVTSPYFLRFLNEGLDRYADEERVFTVCGYNHPPSLMPFPEDYRYNVYFNYRSSSWGWGTWRDRWSSIDWDVSDFASFIRDKESRASFTRGGVDLVPMLQSQMEGRLDSWAIRWCYAQFKQEALALMPVRSLVNNIGLDGSGTHSGRLKEFDNDLDSCRSSWSFPDRIEVDEAVMERFRAVYVPGLLLRCKQLLRRAEARVLGR